MSGTNPPTQETKPAKACAYCNHIFCICVFYVKCIDTYVDMQIKRNRTYMYYFFSPIITIAAEIRTS